MSSQYGELRLTSGGDLLASGEFGAPKQISTGFASLLLHGTLVLGVRQTLLR